MVEGKTRNHYSRVDKVRGKSEWKINSEEQHTNEDSRKKVGESDKRGKKKGHVRRQEKIEEYTRKKTAEMQMIGLQATELYLQTEEAYFSPVLFYFFSSIHVL